LRTIIDLCARRSIKRTTKLASVSVITTLIELFVGSAMASVTHPGDIIVNVTTNPTNAGGDSSTLAWDKTTE
jgi:hypothetical protein